MPKGNRTVSPLKGRKRLPFFESVERKKQNKLAALQFVSAFTSKPYAPSVDDIAKHLKVSWSTAERYVTELVDSGLLSREFGVNRSIAITERGAQAVSLAQHREPLLK